MAMSLKNLESDISAWPEVTVHSHRFGGKEFRLGSAEVGHIHTNGIVDIPFPRALRDALLEEGVAEEHRWVPNSGWVTFHVRKQEDVGHALWLMRLSYLRYKLKSVAEPHALLESESKELHLTPKFTSLFLRFVPAMAGRDLESRSD